MIGLQSDRNFKENKMNIKLDHYLSPLFFARSSLSTCDVDLVKKTLARPSF
ncbi:hypothetical protein [Rickettsiella grylli]|uniref:hypothetical protein n=1 Tax=Rickettsiella grylli TaxID=59196 RepID=UPI000A6F9416|nr:hypothetical protein [Rickettsiella grylli]